MQSKFNPTRRRQLFRLLGHSDSTFEIHYSLAGFAQVLLESWLLFRIPRTQREDKIFSRETTEPSLFHPLFFRIFPFVCLAPWSPWWFLLAREPSVYREEDRPDHVSFVLPCSSVSFRCTKRGRISIGKQIKDSCVIRSTKSKESVYRAKYRYVGGIRAHDDEKVRWLSATMYQLLAIKRMFNSIVGTGAKIRYQEKNCAMDDRGRKFNYTRSVD